MTAPVQETPVHDHPHGEGEHEHDHPHGEVTGPIQPQPVPMNIHMQVVPMLDGTDRVRVGFTSLNGEWVAFFDRQGAIQHAQTLLGLAYSPPVAPPEQSDAPSSDGSEGPLIELVEEPPATPVAEV